MPTIAIVYHSGYGHTKALAEHVLKGANATEGVEATLIPVDELPDPENRVFAGRWAELDDANTIVLGCPTYMGSVSAGMKRFMEATSPKWAEQSWAGKLAAGFSNSGSLDGDKGGTLADLFRFACQHAMLWCPPGILAEGKEPDSINRSGSYMGLAAQSDHGKGPEDAPSAGDRATAERFGSKIAEATKRLG